MIQYLVYLASSVLYLLEEFALESLIFPLTIIGGIGIILSLGFFIIKSVAVCKLAKKRGFKNWWLGMIPYANYYVIGKLVGKMRIFNLVIKNIGVIALISAIIYDLSSVGILLYAIQVIFDLNWVIKYFYDALSAISYVVDILFYASFFMLVMGIFGRYAPHKRTLYSVLCLVTQYLFSIQFYY